MRNASFVVLVAVCVSCVTTPTIAQSKAQSESAAKSAANAPKAEDILRQMADYLGKLPAFSCKLEAVLDMRSGEQQNKAVTNMTVRLRATESIGHDRR